MPKKLQFKIFKKTPEQIEQEQLRLQEYAEQKNSEIKITYLDSQKNEQEIIIPAVINLTETCFSNLKKLFKKHKGWKLLKIEIN